ncbi:hypothetical protein [Halosegnis marinus]|uniref:Uncharacterized protein n=1 Tax=Halosegnis marinus TaxID=3034023 RepID=A0ABD5ZPR3_9EURY|nr:hypothetical protein [Halosegnis sp. DT85]
MANDDLHKPLKAINKTIAKLREDVQTLTGEVKKVHSVIREAAETVRDAIHENIHAQAELKLMDHVMEVKAVEPQIEAEHEQIDAEQAELDERLASIGDRYERQQRELDEKARERIRDLGEHIFALDEEQFEAGIEEPFTEQVTPTWRTLQAHNESVGDERSDRVREAAGDTVQTIHDFVDRQESLIETVRDHRFDAEGTRLPTDERERLQVPYYVVEYEADGVTQREVVVPSSLATDADSEWCRVSLDPFEGAEQLLAGAPGVSEPSRTESLSADAVARHLSDYSESTPLAPSYGEAVREAMPDDGSVPVRIEGGDD